MKKLRFGILSVSNHFIKRIVLPVQKLTNVEIVAIASRSETKAIDTAKKFNIPKAYGSYEAILKDDQIDAVFIPLPNHMHAEWIIKAADAGKHILCEKPMCMNAEEAEYILEYTQKKGVQLMEAFMYKFHPQWQFARDVIRTNNIGKVNFIHTSFSYNNPSPSNIRNIKEYGGGGLMDIGCYAISTPRFLLDKEPISVVSQISYHKDFGTDIITSALLDFGTARASFHVSTSSDAYQKVEIIGDAGHIIIHLPFNTYSDVHAKISVISGIGTREVSFDPVDQYALMFESFSNSILNKLELPYLADDAVLNQKVIDTLLISNKSKNWESVI